MDLEHEKDERLLFECKIIQYKKTSWHLGEEKVISYLYIRSPLNAWYRVRPGFDNIVEDGQHVLSKFIVNFIHFFIVEKDLTNKAQEITYLNSLWDQGPDSDKQLLQ